MKSHPRVACGSDTDQGGSMCSVALICGRGRGGALATAASESAASSAATTIASSTSAATSASVTPVAAIDTALTEGLHVLALLFATPFATTRLLAVIVCTVLGFTRDVVKERPRLVVGDGGVCASHFGNRGFDDRTVVGSLAQRRACDSFLDQVVLVELRVGLGEIKVRVRDVNLGLTLSTATASATTTSGLSGPGSVNPHLVDLLCQVVHRVAVALGRSRNSRVAGVHISHGQSNGCLRGLSRIPYTGSSRAGGRLGHGLGGVTVIDGNGECLGHRSSQRNGRLNTSSDLRTPEGFDSTGGVGAGACWKPGGGAGLGSL
ncbi:hypothetical protein CH063_14901 [Colletotrichum higginsianum]|uniref:Uncharacterized protein n=1 Tax=Colletotrichum higginsianum (strain IMI 349063) TaxID=759273 RepID=H1W0K1_COLHI|nr:hypothetical protein CH063_14901 [Colletotrichum higginsianum]